MYGSAHTIRAFPGGTEDFCPLHLGVLEHPSEDDASIGEHPKLDLGVVVLLDLPLLGGEAGQCVCPLLIYEV